ncbi:MAG: transcription antitermination factor NusB [Gammaproteobacteria bacterium]
MQNEPNQNPTPENNSVKPAARHNARRYAVQAMYQWQLTGHPIIEIENEFLRYHIEKKLDLEYFKELIHAIPTSVTELDAEIKPFMNRSMSDIDPVELSILRIAIYELTKRPDVPYRVIINEALELTKKFGSIEGYKFVNGILDRIAKKTRPEEIGMGRR